MLQEIENSLEIFVKNGLMYGRLLSSSKSLYRNSHKNNIVYFNANIFLEDVGKVWYGDLDLTLDINILQKISNKLKKDLYILTELDGRFENSELSNEQIKNKCVLHIIHKN